MKKFQSAYNHPLTWYQNEAGHFVLNGTYFEIEHFSNTLIHINPLFFVLCDRKGVRIRTPSNEIGGAYLQLSVSTSYEASLENAELFEKRYFTFSEAIEAFEVEVLPYLKEYALNILRDLETI